MAISPHMESASQVMKSMAPDRFVGKLMKMVEKGHKSISIGVLDSEKTNLKGRRVRFSDEKILAKINAAVSSNNIQEAMAIFLINVRTGNAVIEEKAVDGGVQAIMSHKTAAKIASGDIKRLNKQGEVKPYEKVHEVNDEEFHKLATEVCESLKISIDENNTETADKLKSDPAPAAVPPVVKHEDPLHANPVHEAPPLVTEVDDSETIAKTTDKPEAKKIDPPQDPKNVKKEEPKPEPQKEKEAQAQVPSSTKSETKPNTLESPEVHEAPLPAASDAKPASAPSSTPTAAPQKPEQVAVAPPNTATTTTEKPTPPIKPPPPLPALNNAPPIAPQIPVQPPAAHPANATAATPATTNQNAEKIDDHATTKPLPETLQLADEEPEEEPSKQEAP